MSVRVDNPALLVASFRVRVEQLLDALRVIGHAPKLHETYRSPKRAAKLVSDGMSRARGGLSMHCYGVAADVICRRHGWDCEKVGCDFYTRLGEAAERLGMTWGGNWDGDDVTREQREHDLPHVQAIPLSLQNRIRTAAPLRIDAIVAAYFATRSATPANSNG